MDVIVSSRHFEISDELKVHTEEKIHKLEEEYPKLTTARVVMSIERNWQIVEAHVNGKHLVLNAKSQSPDMLVSVDATFEKLQKQLRRYLEKIQNHRAKRIEEGLSVEDDDTVGEEIWMDEEEDVSE